MAMNKSVLWQSIRFAGNVACFTAFNMAILYGIILGTGPIAWDIICGCILSLEIISYIAYSAYNKKMTELAFEELDVRRQEALTRLAETNRESADRLERTLIKHKRII